MRLGLFFSAVDRQALSDTEVFPPFVGIRFLAGEMQHVLSPCFLNPTA